MTDYTELVKALTACGADGKCGKCDYMKSPDSILCMEMLISEAANAIEELQGQIDSWIELERKALIKSMPKWIPVTERLPKVGKKVLVLAYGNEILTARMEKQTENGHPVFECNYNGVFLEMAKPGRITHWMPLPEPPKEET